MRVARHFSRTALLGAALVLSCLGPPVARAEFGFLPGAEGFEVRAEEEGGELADRAGSHPFRMTTEVNFRLADESMSEPGARFTDGDLRDLHLALPPGLIENPSAVPKCSQVRFHAPRQSPFESSLSGESCPADAQVGVVAVRSSFGGGTTRTFGLFNLAPPPGFPSQLGFSPFGMPVTISPHIREAGREYGLTLDLLDFPQQLDVYGLRITAWGTPWNTVHNSERGNCLNEVEPSFAHAKCAVDTIPRLAYLTLPSSCEGPLSFRVAASSWQQPAAVEQVSESEAPLRDCGSLEFSPRTLARLNTDRAGSPSGFELDLTGNGEGLLNPQRRAGSQVKKAVLALPPGITINPSVGAGLGVCTPAQYAAEDAFSPPGAGCPNASKIGELTVKSPLFEGSLSGGLFLAEPDDPSTSEPGAENPFDSLIALYLVAKAPDRGVMVRVAGIVSADPDSGQLTAGFDDLPQLPYADFELRFRDTQRAALASPPACGTYTTEIELTPWLDLEAPLQLEFPSGIGAGIGGGACPAGTPSFRPGAVAGMLNRAAGAYTPFYLHLTRTDAEQEMTSYSALLPPGLTGKLKGIPYCPDAAIAAAKLRSGVAELRDPSCPAATQIGHTTAGYGLSSVLAYAPGGLYLAGPYHGAPFSIVAIDSALVGPFDLGVIIVRSAIRVDRRTAQVSVDSTRWDPIPHIVKGIPIHLRDVRLYIDRPGFTLNPTSCEPFSTISTVSGSGDSFASSADDSDAAVPSPFQVSNCAALGFEPRIALRLRGGTKRGDYPSLRAIVRPRPGDANIGRVAVALPPSLFLAQEHIRTICTRAQFAARSCPRRSVYGHAEAVTPLLGRPLEGPVYLRSSDNQLPDLVADLGGNGIEIEVAGRIDSVRGGLRGTFDVIPDAPVAKFTMTLDGGRRSPLVNAGDLCSGSARAEARMLGHNSRGIVRRPKVVATGCRMSGRARTHQQSRKRHRSRRGGR